MLCFPLITETEAAHHCLITTFKLLSLFQPSICQPNYTSALEITKTGLPTRGGASVNPCLAAASGRFYYFCSTVAFERQRATDFINCPLGKDNSLSCEHVLVCACMK